MSSEKLCWSCRHLNECQILEPCNRFEYCSNNYPITKGISISDVSRQTGIPYREIYSVKRSKSKAYLSLLSKLYIIKNKYYVLDGEYFKEVSEEESPLFNKIKGELEISKKELKMSKAEFLVYKPRTCDYLDVKSYQKDYCKFSQRRKYGTQHLFSPDPDLLAPSARALFNKGALPMVKVYEDLETKVVKKSSLSGKTQEGDLAVEVIKTEIPYKPEEQNQVEMLHVKNEVIRVLDQKELDLRNQLKKLQSVRAYLERLL